MRNETIAITLRNIQEMKMKIKRAILRACIQVIQILLGSLLGYYIDQARKPIREQEKVSL